MEEKIYEVLRKHKLPLKKREELIVDLLDLFLSVSGSLSVKVEEMEFKPKYPYLSDVISWENGNIWELHELYPEDQKIIISRNKNYRKVTQ